MRRRDFPQVKRLKTADAFLAHLDDARRRAALRRPARRRRARPRRSRSPDARAPNRFAILPMEGWDGTDDGRPTDLVRRRWARFGTSGAGLVWGGEAFAVRPDGRANPHQLCLGPVVGRRPGRAPRASSTRAGDRPPAHPQRPLVRRARGPARDRPAARRRAAPGRCSPPPSSTRSPTTTSPPPALARDAGLRLRRREGVPRLPPPRAARPATGDARAERAGHAAHRSSSGSAAEGIPRRRAPLRLRPAAAPRRARRRRRAGGAGALGLRRRRSRSLDLLGVDLLCVTAGSPYYCPHAQRPAYFPPSDGYAPPEDPLVGVARLLDARRRHRRRPPARHRGRHRLLLPPGVAAARGLGVVRDGRRRPRRHRPHGAELPRPPRRRARRPAARPAPPVPHLQRLHHRAAQRPRVRLLSPRPDSTRSTPTGAARSSKPKRARPCAEHDVDAASAVVGLGIGQMHVWSWRRMKDRFAVVAVVRPRRGPRPTDAAERTGADVVTFDEAHRARRRRHRRPLHAAVAPPRADHRRARPPASTSCARSRSSPRCATVDALAEAEAASAGRLMPIFQYRFGNGLQKVKALVDAGVAGPAYTSSVEVAWRRRADYYAVPWRGRWATELGGVLLSQAVHAIDMLTYIAGPPAGSSPASTTRVNDIEVEDCAAVSLELADGSLATITATLGSTQEITRHRFHFADLSAESGTSRLRVARPTRGTSTPDDDDAAAAIAEVLDGWEPRRRGLVGPVRALRRLARRTAPIRPSPSPTPARRSSSSPRCTTRPAAASTSRCPSPPTTPLRGWLPMTDRWTYNARPPQAAQRPPAADAVGRRRSPATRPTTTRGTTGSGSRSSSSTSENFWEEYDAYGVLRHVDDDDRPLDPARPRDRRHRRRAHAHPRRPRRDDAYAIDWDITLDAAGRRRARPHRVHDLGRLRRPGPAGPRRLDRHPPAARATAPSTSGCSASTATGSTSAARSRAARPACSSSHHPDNHRHPVPWYGSTRPPPTATRAGPTSSTPRSSGTTPLDVAGRRRRCRSASGSSCTTACGTPTGAPREWERCTDG